MKLLGANKGLCVSVFFVSAGYTRRLKGGHSVRV